MEKLSNSRITESTKSEMICYGVGLPKVESSEKEDSSCEGQYFENNTEDKAKPDIEPLQIPQRSQFGASEVLKIETIPNPESLTSKSQLEFDTKVTQRNPMLREVERLEIQKQALETKAQELKRKITKGRLEKTKKGSYLLEIKNTEKKIEMLGKRISYEKRITSPPLFRWKRGVKSIKQTSKSLYVNSLRSDEVLARNMRSKLVLRGKEERGSQTQLSEDLIEEQTSKAKKEKSLEKWQSRWKELVSEEESDEELEILGVVIKKPKRTTVFYPPIPDPMAKKRPKDSIPMKQRLGETGGYRNSETRIRLVPNRKRVLQNRVALFRKQLEFENRHGLDTEDTIENLDQAALDCQQYLNDEELLPPVTRQQLHLMGALSDDQNLHEDLPTRIEPAIPVIKQ